MKPQTKKTKPSLVAVQVVRTDGRWEHHRVPPHNLVRTLCGLIGAEIGSTVNLRDGRVMVVDDHGYETEMVQDGNRFIMVPVRALKPVNETATKIYHHICKPRTTHQIVGDVAIAWDEDF